MSETEATAREPSLERALRHLRLVPGDPDEAERAAVGAYLEAARAYVRDHCSVTDDYIDAHPDLQVAVLALTADLYDERGATAESSRENRVVSSILSHHDYNLVSGGGYEEQ